MRAAQYHSLPTSMASFGVVRPGKAAGLGLIVFWSALGLAFAALGIALGFGPEITAALAE